MKTLLERLSKLDRDTIINCFQVKYPYIYEDLISDLKSNTNFCNIKLGTAYDLCTALDCKINEIPFKFLS